MIKRYSIYQRKSWKSRCKLVGEYNKFEMAKRFVEVIYENEIDCDEERWSWELFIVDNNTGEHYVFKPRQLGCDRVWM